MKKLALVLLALPLIVAACDEKKADDQAAASASAAVAASAPVASAAPTVAAAPAVTATLPSQADEAVKAEKEISKANYKQELDKLDKEISGK